MTKPQLSLKRRILRLFLWLVGIAMAFFVYGELLVPQTTFYLLAAHMAYKDPTVNVVPQYLANSTCSKSPGTTLSYYGISFDVPWRGIAEQKVVHNITVVRFASGEALMWTTKKQEMIGGALSILATLRVRRTAKKLPP